MPEVASFMRMYPAYKLRDVLEEYAIIFFSLLNEGYRQENRRYETLAILNDLPFMGKDERKEIYNKLKWASMHPSDILNLDGDGSTPAEIKKLLG